ncbi:hypothetical protein CHU98_g3010 [Xylaria longipes]|nr:hypothetical protein CHU98_g3010 [Xylaria longipes]
MRYRPDDEVNAMVLSGTATRAVVLRTISRYQRGTGQAAGDDEAITLDSQQSKTLEIQNDNDERATRQVGNMLGTCQGRLAGSRLAGALDQERPQARQAPARRGISAGQALPARSFGVINSAVEANSAEKTYIPEVSWE